ncbi:MAG: S-methyl-5-thioribose-1-phosphate isomerase [Desulfovibrionaceae bacterium]|nr:S-methyl-5-thioribose-1-phosphate isomerase [Desulfovibrionaceae bacterium]
MQNHICFDDSKMELNLLDQRFLPRSESYYTCKKVEDVIYALKEMVVRGAPAIGVTAAFGAVLACHELRDTKENFRSQLAEKLQMLEKARPTAVNLSWAIERMRKIKLKNPSATLQELTQLFLEEAYAIQKEDLEICHQIGRFGAPLIPKGATVMTHCNAGALATAGFGTALGVIRAAYALDKSLKVIANETRPFLQGSRLTCYELAKDNIPVTLACDNACALLMSKGLVQCVVVGADRIAKNGDTANKIGTSGVAILAKHFNIPFYVAAPRSTFDPTISEGSQIVIEERPASEVRSLFGAVIVEDTVPVYNFAFDVTKAEFITGIICEVGVLKPPYTSSIAEALAI